ncbi:MAG: glycoside hydrolase family 16 protein [Bacteroidales bacterium]|nr:glycoside hydrolase family 16 protein [Bacteroidales bacterium]
MKKNIFLSLIIAVFFCQINTVLAKKAAAVEIDSTKLITVLSPEYCSDINGETRISFKAPGEKTATVKCWIQDATWGHDSVFTPVKLNRQGIGKFIFRADRFPHGPLCIRINAGNDHCYLQLYNTGGISWNEGIPASPPQASGMKLVFQDDFNGPLSISSSGTGTTYRSRHTGGNFSSLPFADFESPKNPFSQKDSYLRIRGDVNKGSTGLISTQYSCSVQYGYFECRFIAPMVTGSWPAFWGVTSPVEGERGGDEIDVIEAYGAAPDLYQANWHIWAKEHTAAPKPEDIHMTNIGGKSNWSATFHTYGVLIKPDSVTYYCDNIKVWQHPTTPYLKKSPFYVMINLAIGGGGWPYDLRRYNNVADMYVDYVRVFQYPRENEQ